MSRKPMSRESKIDRRTFMGAAAPFALAMPMVLRKHLVFGRGDYGPEDLAHTRQTLLAMVNRERVQNGQSRLELDDLASRVATNQARDMVDALYLSHWNRDGQKPYQRYSFAGGTEANQENAARLDDVSTDSPQEIDVSVIDLHKSMIDELPPDDGHRQTILFPYHTHVGFGVAAKPDHVRMVELYISRYAIIDPVPRSAPPGTQLIFSGRLLNPKHTMEGIHVYYEPMPQRPDLEWLRVRRSYNLPDSFTDLWPLLPGRELYSDGTKGTIETNLRGNFKTPLRLFNQPGINTIVVWITRTKEDLPFPITQICIRCE
jgi:uncharacterized protein YkwD